MKDVALVLSSGGPRGWAYIGAIEELESRGYNITSIAGTSIGSLVGGIYAAGKLPELKEWLFTLNTWKVFDLMDLSISMNHLVKGDKVINALKEIVPDIDIRDLKIPFRAVAADLHTGEEVVFDQGPLFEAVRASISIPSLFRPVKYGFRTLVDGGIVNTMPINRIVRHDGDILIAFDVNDIDVDKMRGLLIEDAQKAEDRLKEEQELDQENKKVMNSVRNNPTLSVMDKIRLVTDQGIKVLNHAWNKDTSESEIQSFDDNSTVRGVRPRANHALAKAAAESFPPDVLVKMPFDDYDEIADYAHAKDISEAGRKLMKAALDRYESELENN